MKRLSTCLLLLIHLLPVLAQTKRERYVDSLKLALIQSTPTENLEQYARLAEQYRNMSLDSADKYAHLGEELAYRLKNDEKLIQFYDLLGQIHHLKGQYLISTKYFNDGLEKAIQSENTKMTVFLKNSVGISLMTVGANQRALALFQDAQKGFAEMEMVQPEVSALLNMGVIYVKEKDTDRAISVYRQALEKSREIDKQRLVNRALTKLGNIFEELEIYDSATVYYQNALGVALESAYQTQIITNYNDLAGLETLKGNYEQAAVLYQLALETTDPQKDLSLIQYIKEGQGNLARARRNSAEAIRLYLESLSIAQSLRSDSRVMEMHKKLSEYYKEIGNPSQALFHFEGYNELKEQFLADENNRRVDEMEARHLLDQKEKQIHELENEKEARRMVNYGLGMIVFLVLMVLLVLYNRYRIKKRTSKALEEYNQKIKLQNKLLENQRSALDEQNEKLRRANSDLEQFVYIASHDLREPLRTINSYIGLLKMRYRDKLDSPAHDFIDFASEGVERLDSLLIDLLEYSRIGHTGVHHVAVNLNQVLQKVLHGLDKQIEETGTTITLPELPTLPGFATELLILFQNIISNAIKFGKSDTNPKIIINSKKEDGFWIISIQDNGIGMDQIYHEKVFAIFQRLNVREKYTGTGIGLAICKRIVENHKGEIWFESKLDKGTTFFIKLPAL
ncbi:MAG: tetratricopeptide repeat protein [Bacteroidetes bacterium]|nr:tetratricopeptide repeat protein [Bacteroidota bacterium]